MLEQDINYISEYIYGENKANWKYDHGLLIRLDSEKLQRRYTINGAERMLILKDFIYCEKIITIEQWFNIKCEI